jgi:hypothetical protein
MSTTTKKPAFKVNAQARTEAILAKINDFVGGERTEEEQLELVVTGLVVLVDVLRELRGDVYVQGFLQSALKDVSSGKKMRFRLIKPIELRRSDD